MWKIIFLSTFFVTASAWATLEFTHFVSGCRLTTKVGQASTVFPGWFCLFGDDGTLYSATDTHLRAFGKDNSLLWELEGEFHHQLNFNHDRTKLLTLSSSSAIYKKEASRVDRLLVISLDGKVLRQQDSHEMFRARFVEPSQWLSRSAKHHIELSHFNSFHEIPKLTTKRKLPSYVRAGNYVANSLFHGIFYLDPDLKVLHHDVSPYSRNHEVHDVQVLGDGSLLYFNNLNAGSGTQNLYSTVDNVDPTDWKMLHQFSGSPKGIFYSINSSGVQQLDEDHWLFSHVFEGFYVYRKSTRELVTHMLHYTKGATPIHVQQVRAFDLRKFLTARGMDPDH